MPCQIPRALKKQCCWVTAGQAGLGVPLFSAPKDFWPPEPPVQLSKGASHCHRDATCVLIQGEHVAWCHTGSHVAGLWKTIVGMLGTMSWLFLILLFFLAAILSRFSFSLRKEGNTKEGVGIHNAHRDICRRAFWALVGSPCCCIANTALQLKEKKKWRFY